MDQVENEGQEDGQQNPRDQTHACPKRQPESSSQKHRARMFVMVKKCLHTSLNLALKQRLRGGDPDLCADKLSALQKLSPELDALLSLRLKRESSDTLKVVLRSVQIAPDNISPKYFRENIVPQEIQQYISKVSQYLADTEISDWPALLCGLVEKEAKVKVASQKCTRNNGNKSPKNPKASSVKAGHSSRPGHKEQSPTVKTRKERKVQQEIVENDQRLNKKHGQKDGMVDGEEKNEEIKRRSNTCDEGGLIVKTHKLVAENKVVQNCGQEVEGDISIHREHREEVGNNEEDGVNSFAINSQQTDTRNHGEGDHVTNNQETVEILYNHQGHENPSADVEGQVKVFDEGKFIDSQWDSEKLDILGQGEGHRKSTDGHRQKKEQGIVDRLELEQVEEVQNHPQCEDKGNSSLLTKRSLVNSGKVQVLPKKLKLSEEALQQKINSEKQGENVNRQHRHLLVTNVNVRVGKVQDKAKPVRETLKQKPLILQVLRNGQYRKSCTKVTESTNNSPDLNVTDSIGSNNDLAGQGTVSLYSPVSDISEETFEPSDINVRNICDTEGETVDKITSSKTVCSNADVTVNGAKAKKVSVDLYSSLSDTSDEELPDELVSDKPKGQIVPPKESNSEKVDAVETVTSGIELSSVANIKDKVADKYATSLYYNNNNHIYLSPTINTNPSNNSSGNTELDATVSSVECTRNTLSNSNSVCTKTTSESYSGEQVQKQTVSDSRTEEIGLTPSITTSYREPVSPVFKSPPIIPVSQSPTTSSYSAFSPLGNQMSTMSLTTVSPATTKQTKTIPGGCKPKSSATSSLVDEETRSLPSLKFSGGELDKARKNLLQALEKTKRLGVNRTDRQIDGISSLREPNAGIYTSGSSAIAADSRDMTRKALVNPASDDISVPSASASPTSNSAGTDQAERNINKGSTKEGLSLDFDESAQVSNYCKCSSCTRGRLSQVILHAQALIKKADELLDCTCAACDSKEQCFIKWMDKFAHLKSLIKLMVRAKPDPSDQQVVDDLYKDVVGDLLPEIRNEWKNFEVCFLQGDIQNESFESFKRKNSEDKLWSALYDYVFHPVHTKKSALIFRDEYFSFRTPFCKYLQSNSQNNPQPNKADVNTSQQTLLGRKDGSSRPQPEGSASRRNSEDGDGISKTSSLSRPGLSMNPIIINNVENSDKTDQPDSTTPITSSSGTVNAATNNSKKSVTKQKSTGQQPASQSACVPKGKSNEQSTKQQPKRRSSQLSSIPQMMPQNQNPENMVRPLYLMPGTNQPGPFRPSHVPQPRPPPNPTQSQNLIPGMAVPKSMQMNTSSNPNLMMPRPPNAICFQQPQASTLQQPYHQNALHGHANMPAIRPQGAASNPILEQQGQRQIDNQPYIPQQSDNQSTNWQRNGNHPMQQTGHQGNAQVQSGNQYNHQGSGHQPSNQTNPQANDHLQTGNQYNFQGSEHPNNMQTVPQGNEHLKTGNQYNYQGSEHQSNIQTAPHGNDQLQSGNQYNKQGSERQSTIQTPAPANDQYNFQRSEHQPNIQIAPRGNAQVLSGNQYNHQGSGHQSSIQTAAPANDQLQTGNQYNFQRSGHQPNIQTAPRGNTQVQSGNQYNYQGNGHQSSLQTAAPANDHLNTGNQYNYQRSGHQPNMQTTPQGNDHSQTGNQYNYQGNGNQPSIQPPYPNPTQPQVTRFPNAPINNRGPVRLQHNNLAYMGPQRMNTQTSNSQTSQQQIQFIRQNWYRKLKEHEPLIDPLTKFITLQKYQKIHIDEVLHTLQNHWPCVLDWIPADNQDAVTLRKGFIFSLVLLSKNLHHDNNGFINYLNIGEAETDQQTHNNNRFHAPNPVQPTMQHNPANIQPQNQLPNISVRPNFLPGVVSNSQQNIPSHQGYNQNIIPAPQRSQQPQGRPRSTSCEGDSHQGHSKGHSLLLQALNNPESWRPDQSSNVGSNRSANHGKGSQSKQDKRIPRSRLSEGLSEQGSRTQEVRRSAEKRRASEPDRLDPEELDIPEIHAPRQKVLRPDGTRGYRHPKSNPKKNLNPPSSSGSHIPSHNTNLQTSTTIDLTGEPHTLPATSPNHPREDQTPNHQHPPTTSATSSDPIRTDDTSSSSNTPVSAIRNCRSSSVDVFIRKHSSAGSDKANRSVSAPVPVLEPLQASSTSDLEVHTIEPSAVSADQVIDVDEDLMNCFNMGASYEDYDNKHLDQSGMDTFGFADDDLDSRNIPMPIPGQVFHNGSEGRLTDSAAQNLYDFNSAGLNQNMEYQDINACRSLFSACAAGSESVDSLMGMLSPTFGQMISSTNTQSSSSMTSAYVPSSVQISSSAAVLSPSVSTTLASQFTSTFANSSQSSADIFVASSGVSVTPNRPVSPTFEQSFTLPPVHSLPVNTETVSMTIGPTSTSTTVSSSSSTVIMSSGVPLSSIHPVSPTYEQSSRMSTTGNNKPSTSSVAFSSHSIQNSRPSPTASVVALTSASFATSTPSTASTSASVPSMPAPTSTPPLVSSMSLPSHSLDEISPPPMVQGTFQGGLGMRLPLSPKKGSVGELMVEISQEGLEEVQQVPLSVLQGGNQGPQAIDYSVFNLKPGDGQHLPDDFENEVGIRDKDDEKERLERSEEVGQKGVIVQEEQSGDMDEEESVGMKGECEGGEEGKKNVGTSSDDNKRSDWCKMPQGLKRMSEAEFVTTDKQGVKQPRTSEVGSEYNSNTSSEVIKRSDWCKMPKGLKRRSEELLSTDKPGIKQPRTSEVGSEYNSNATSSEVILIEDNDDDDEPDNSKDTKEQLPSSDKNQKFVHRNVWDCLGDVTTSRPNSRNSTNSTSSRTNENNASISTNTPKPSFLNRNLQQRRRDLHHCDSDSGISDSECNGTNEVNTIATSAQEGPNALASCTSAEMLKYLHSRQKVKWCDCGLGFYEAHCKHASYFSHFASHRHGNDKLCNACQEPCHDARGLLVHWYETCRNRHGKGAHTQPNRK